MALKDRYYDSWRADCHFKSLAEVDWECVRAAGIKLVLLDIDNTLARHGSFSAEPYAVAQVKRILDAGLACWLLSNAVGRRIESYAASLGIRHLGQANKPSGRKIRRAILKENVKPEETLIVGDQLFTDIWAGKRAGTKTMLVDKLFDDEAWNVRLKRRLECLITDKYECEPYRHGLFDPHDKND